MKIFYYMYVLMISSSVFPKLYMEHVELYTKYISVYYK